jgi:hypothetical protein
METVLVSRNMSSVTAVVLHCHHPRRLGGGGFVFPLPWGSH